MKCLFHPKKCVRFECITCKGLKFCRQCAITIHVDHEVRKITFETDEQPSFLKEAEDASVGAKKCSNDIINLRKEIEDAILAEVNQIEQRAKDVTNVIFKIAKQMVGALLEIRDNKLKIISDWERQISKCEEKFRQVKKCKTHDNKIDMQVFKEFFSYKHYFNSIYSSFASLQDYKSELPIFKKADCSEDEFEKVLGELVWREVPSSCMDDSDAANGSIFTDKGYISTESTSSDSTTFLHAKNNVIRSLCPVADDHCWVIKETALQADSEIALIDAEGRLKEARVLDSGILDVTSSSGTTYISCHDKSIRRLHGNGSSSVKFKVKSRPESLCLMRNQTFVLCFHKNGMIYKCDNKGQELTTLERGNDNIVSHPFRARSNHSQTKIAVLNADPYSLLVLDENLCVNFFYDGNATYYPGQLQHIPKKSGSLFDSFDIPSLDFAPNDVCFDSNDNVLLTDCANMSLNIINIKGIPLKSVKISRNFFPCAVVLNATNTLWVGFNNGFMKIKKGTNLYLKNS